MSDTVGKYKAFYFKDVTRYDQINETIAACVKLTKENLNKIYPSNKELILNIKEVDLMVQAFNLLQRKLEEDNKNL